MPTKVLRGDCRAVMRELAPDSVDAIVTDPPYHLTSTVKRFGGKNAAPAQYGTDGAFARASRGFMGQTWDGGGVAFEPQTWAEALRVLKPGGHLLAFGGTRTFHRLVCAIEDAGFEVRDLVAWTYGQGFPKSKNIGEGRGTALKPAIEPICMARKPLSEKSVAANVLRWGTGAINVGACRVESSERPVMVRTATVVAATSMSGKSTGATANGETTSLGRWPANLILSYPEDEYELRADVTSAQKRKVFKWLSENP